MAARGISIHKYPVHFFLGCVAPHPLQNADSKRRWQPTNIRKKRYKTFLFETKRERKKKREKERQRKKKKKKKEKKRKLTKQKTKRL